MSTPAANTVAWFEIGAPDVRAAKDFYGPLFGWTFAPDGEHGRFLALRRGIVGS